MITLLELIRCNSAWRDNTILNIIEVDDEKGFSEPCPISCSAASKVMASREVGFFSGDFVLLR